MKHFSALLILLLVGLSSQTVRAQAPDSWVSVPLSGEGFLIQMPKSHVVKSYKNSFEQFKVDGRVYTATEDGVEYAVWSLVDDGYAIKDPLGTDAYLDACADLVWESLLKPLRDKLPKKPEVVSFMAYQRALEATRLHSGREYAITLGDKSGLTHFYVAGPNIHVLTVLNPQASFAGIQRFLNSAGLKKPTLPTAAASIKDPILVPPAGVGTGGGVGPGTGGGIGPGRGGNIGGGDRSVGGGAPSTSAAGSTDYNRVFSGKDVTQKARILSKPEPQYTESARKYSVTGTVVLRAVFSSSGQVIQIKAISGLPHGLTLRSIAAARNIKFTPAVKDGHDVSMWFQLEYNYNLY